jgi:subtilisin-like proprotein convertase family protein
LRLEELEDRRVPSTLPVPVITGHTAVIAPPIDPSPTFNQNFSSPSIAVDPTNPNSLAAVWVEHDHNTNANPVDSFSVDAAVSTNGGNSWSRLFLPGNLVDPLHTTTTNFVTFQVDSDASVAFDRSHNFYILESQHSADNSAGALVLFKYSFSSSPTFIDLTPQIGGAFADPTQGKVLYEWINDQVLHPTMTIDTGVSSFSDSGFTQTDPSAGNIYVAWATNNVQPTGTLPGGISFNPNTIQVMASNDGGNTFTPEQIVNDGFGRTVSITPNTNGGPFYSIPGTYFGPERDTSPVLAVSQGTARSSTVPGGQLNVAWDDFGTFGTATPPAIPLDRVMVDRVNNTAMATVGAFASVNHVSPTGFNLFNDPLTDNGTTTDTLSVSAPADFGSVTDMSVTLELIHANLSQLDVVLVPPAGSGFFPITLFQHQPTGNNRVGISGTNLGTLDSLEPFLGRYFDNANPPVLHTVGGLGTVFDEHSSRSILDRGIANHFVGHFLPELGSLSQFNGMTRAQLTSAPWTLEITDNVADTNPVQFLIGWSLNFTSGLTPNLNTEAAITTVHGALSAPYPLRPTASPDTGIGPGISIASDNTLGAFSPNQGNLYIAYVNRIFVLAPNFNPADNTDIYMLRSTDGGITWNPFTNPDNTANSFAVNDDQSIQDGFTDAGTGSHGTGTLFAGRPQYEPSIAVDQSTGTLVLTWYDARDDAARARVARFVATSIDGGVTFGPQTYLNTSSTATDQITRQTVNLGPLPDNDSSGNGDRDTILGFGDHQGLTVLNGHIYAAWTGDENGGVEGRNATTNSDFTERFGILSAQATIASGPRILTGTMGPVVPTSFASDGTPIVDRFTVTFDRFVDPGTFLPSDVSIVYRNVNTPGTSPGTPITSNIMITPLDASAFGATQFLVTFAPQTGVGTYSYAIGPNISDRIRTTTSLGNAMDQDQDANPFGLSGADVFDVPHSLRGGGPPFDLDTLPIILPGPHVVSTSVANGSGSDNLVLNGTVSAITVTFDRDMDPTSITGASLLRLIGPSGLIGPEPGAAIPASFTVTQLSTRSFRFNFRTPDGSQALTLDLSGTYTLQLSSSMRSARGDELDTNLNAGLDMLRDTASAGTTPEIFTNSTPVAISGAVTDSTITVPDNFVMTSSQGLTVSLNITYPVDPDLTATLISPNGTRITLFNQVGNTGTEANFTNTVLDDTTTTPITAGGPPFTGRFNPQQPLGDLFLGGPISSMGTWKLEVADSSASRTGIINSWTLTLSKPIPSTGLGEPVADQATASFRIFTEDPTNPVSHQTWTSVGPGENGTGHGRIGGIAVDPSDPSGNTVFVAGASGGVWKTTDFLTSSSAGPTYIPLTDFGPTFGINIGGLAVFGRNNDPTQSIVFAATGEGDTGSTGVGFLRSMDGGATWTLLDSTNNVDANGNPLPFNSPMRDHIFVGTSAFKVMVDPRPTTSGKVIVYAALVGTHGGVWRSTDSGAHWQLMRAGQATDITFDLNSGRINTISNPTGNLEVLFAGFRGEGVFITPNQGGVWNEMLGGVGDPLIQDRDNSSVPVPIPVAAPSGVPTGGKGRIELAHPALTGQFLADGSYVGGDPLQDLIYEGWLYVLVTQTNSHLDGLYVTKDFGQNWTKVRMPNEQSGLAGIVNAIPSNDPSLPDYDVFGGGNFTQGNYDSTLAIDPVNPNVVYLGGTADGQPTGFIRVDTTGLADPHAFYLGNQNTDGGALQYLATGPVNLKNWPDVPGRDIKPMFSPYLNLIRNPFDPFNANSTFYVSNTLQFANTGIGAKWKPFDLGGTDQHRIVTFRDPLTGNARLIIGDDQGMFTALDIDGTLSGGALSGEPEQGGGPDDRNGNLQIAQYYYGAVQPSSAAAQIAGALFYTGVQDGALDQSNPNVLTNGNLTWGSDGQGDGGGVAVDQTGSGTRYQYMWPCCGGNTTDFFRVNGVGRTFGLIQQSSGGLVPDPQWPFGGVLNFAVNPINGSQIDISSAAGRIFGTSDQGQTWFVIGDPGSLDGSIAPAIAFGAPDPADPSGALNDFVYAGTNAGHIFVTFRGGGANGNLWQNLSAGLDGSGVRAIVTNPTRGSHEAYAVTFQGVYHMVDSTAANATWVNITGNLFQVMHTLFGPFSDSNPVMTDTQLRSLEAIQADWRYGIPNNPSELTNPVVPPGPTHPALYVGGEGGVYRSVDDGTTWTLFPDTQTDGAPQAGGFLPNAHVTDLKLALGNIDPTNGRPQISSSPDVLFATTYGRGTFAIRVAPIIVANSVYLDPSQIVGPNTTNKVQPIIHGMSELGAFGNTVTIQLLDSNGNVVGTGTTDGTGRFAVQVNPGVLLPDGSQDGTVTFRIRAMDGAGVIGEAVPFSFTLDTHPTIRTVILDPASDSGRSNSDGITNVVHPQLDGTVTQSGSITINVFDVTGGGSTLVGTTTTDVNGNFSLVIDLSSHVPTPTLGLTISLNVVAVHMRPSTFPFSMVLDTVAPTAAPPQLQGDTGNHQTSNTTPTFTGTGEVGAQVELFSDGTRVDNPATPTIIGSTGSYTISVSALTPLTRGTTHQITVTLTDAAGNVSARSTPPLVISVTSPITLTPPTITLDPAFNIGVGGQNLANVIPQQYDGTSDPGTTVVVKDGTTPVDTFVVDATGHYTRIIALANGTHSLTLVATDSQGDSANSAAPLVVTVDTTRLDPDRKFVQAIYNLALGRPGSPQEWNAWVQLLSQPNGRLLVANDIERSFEARDHVVRGWYQTFLGRAPQNGEEAGLAQAMVNGATEEQVLAVILGSQEYFNHAPSIPGVGGQATNTTFIQALYLQLLNRTPSQGEINAWLTVLAGIGRTGVATAFLGSAEYRTDVITSFYSVVLRRSSPPSASEVSLWVNSGFDFLSIEIFFESSTEFFFRVTGSLPG